MFNLLIICFIHLLVNDHSHVIPKPYDIYFFCATQKEMFHRISMLFFPESVELFNYFYLMNQGFVQHQTVS